MKKRKTDLRTVIQNAIIGWETNDVGIVLTYKKQQKKVRCLVDVITEAVENHLGKPDFEAEVFS